MKKSTFRWLGLVLSSLALLYSIWTTWPDGRTRVIFCDVGQGDAALIIQGSTQILIDTGRNNAVIACLESHLPFWDRQLELVIATHADSDHIGGLTTVLNRYFVKELTISQYGSKTDVFWSLRAAVLREKSAGMSLNLMTNNSNRLMADNLLLYNFISRVEGQFDDPFLESNTETQLWDKIDRQNQVLGAQSLSLNALSIVTLLQVGQVQFLLTGDLDAAGEQALIDRGLIGDVEVLKVGHHGSKTSTSESFLAVTRPEIAVISVGKNNSYRHPSPQVEAKLSQFGAKILRTDEQGEVVIVTDGQQFWLE